MPLRLPLIATKTMAIQKANNQNGSSLSTSHLILVLEENAEQETKGKITMLKSLKEITFVSSSS